MSLDDEYTDYLKKPRVCKVCAWLRELREQKPDAVVFFQRRGPDNVAKMTRFCHEKLGLEANETTVRDHFRGNHDIS